MKIPETLDTRPVNVARVGVPVDDAASKQVEVVVVDEKEKQLKDALADKKKLLSILHRLKKTFDGFSKRHADLT